MSTSRRGRARWIVLGAVILTIASYQLPYGEFVVYPMILLSTYAHEMGHGLAALMSGGSFDAFVMYADGSGAAITSAASGLARAFTAAGGLVGPAIVGAIFFVCSAKPRVARGTLAASSAFIGLTLLLFVRNLFGWAFLSVVALGCAAVARRGTPLVAQSALAFLAAQMSASVFARSDYLFTRTAQTAQGPMASDVAQIADVLWLPFWFWGALCGAFSVAVLIGGLTVFWRNTASH